MSKGNEDGVQERDSQEYNKFSEIADDTSPAQKKI